MKKLLLPTAALLLANNLCAQSIDVTSNWVLKGAKENITNLSTAFDNKCVDYVWSYGKKADNTMGWKIHKASGTADVSSIPTMTSIDAGDGFWVKGNSDCTVDTTSIGQANSPTISVANGFSANWLDGRNLFVVYNTTIYRLNFSNSKNAIYNAESNSIIKDKNNKEYNQAYTITDDGMLKVDESGVDDKTDNSSDRYQYYKILSIDGTKISLCDGDLYDIQNCNNTSTQFFFTNETDAQNFYNN